MDNVVEFIPRETWEQRLLAQQAAIPKPSQSSLLSALLPEYTRKDIIDDYRWVFEQIGGRPAFALWALANPNEFYRLYSRLLPSGNSESLGESNTLTIEHILPRTDLDK